MGYGEERWRRSRFSCGRGRIIGHGRIDMTSGKPKSGENYLGRKSRVTAAKKGGKFICGQQIS